MPSEELCEGLPDEFIYYLDYVKNLKFSEKPDYIYLRKIFRKLFIKNEYKYDRFQWETCNNKIKTRKFNVFKSPKRLSKK